MQNSGSAEFQKKKSVRSIKKQKQKQKQEQKQEQECEFRVLSGEGKSIFYVSRSLLLSTHTVANLEDCESEEKKSECSSLSLY